MKYSHIAVEGLIGAGKTTLAQRLAKDLGARCMLEEFDDNPFLPQFYADQERYAFAVELAFLAQRYHQLKRLTEQDLFSELTITDHTIGKSLVFAGVTLAKDELALFMDLFGIMYNDLPKPDLIVYLHLSTDRIRERITERGRGYEQRISAEYLGDLYRRYMDHLRKIATVPVLILDLDHADLLHEPTQYQQVLELLHKPHAPGLQVVRIASMVDR